jgi:hypothetical protein
MGDDRDPSGRTRATPMRVHGLTIITRDPPFAAFGCKVPS